MQMSQILINKIVILSEPNSSPHGKRHYRFNDVINHLGYYWKESTEFVIAQPYFKNTILRTYIEQCPDKNLDQVNPNKLQLLCDIIQSKIQTEVYRLPMKNELVIHLRIGDVVVFDWFLQKDYTRIIQNFIDAHQIKKVTFCAAFHYGNNTTQGLWMYSDKKHCANVTKLTELFENVLREFPHVDFDVKSSANVDDDFIYMVMARHFVEDNGGFSQLIRELRECM
jgi:hypothetical protein